MGSSFGLLLEHSFHTNKNASLWLLDDGNLQKLAILEADLLAEYYGLSATDTTVDTDNFTPIMGTAKVLAERMKRYLLSVNPLPPIIWNLLIFF